MNWMLLGIIVALFAAGFCAGWLVFFYTDYRKMMHLRDNLDAALRKELELWKQAAQGNRTGVIMTTDQEHVEAAERAVHTLDICGPWVTPVRDAMHWLLQDRKRRALTAEERRSPK